MDELVKVRDKIMELRDHVVQVKGQLDLDLPGNKSVWDEATGQIRGYRQVLEILDEMSG